MNKLCGAVKSFARNDALAVKTKPCLISFLSPTVPDLYFPLQHGSSHLLYASGLHYILYGGYHYHGNHRKTIFFFFFFRITTYGKAIRFRAKMQYQ